MSENKTSRLYDIVLVGATGYTGSITATHIAEHLPTNLKWSIAGRSAIKLDALAAKLKSLAIDRLAPGSYSSINEEWNGSLQVGQQSRLSMSKTVPNLVP